MYRRWLSTLAIGVAIAACSDQDEESPTAPDLARPSTGCNYTNVKQYARSLFGANSPEYDLAQAMSGYPAGSAEATALAFDLFAAIAAKRNGGGFTSDNVTDAANLTVESLRCATVSQSGAASVTIFQAALAATGAYEVRGDANKDLNTTPVTTGDGLAGVNAPGGSFSSWLSGVRTLFYARPTSTFSSELSNGRAYDWSIIQPGAQLSGFPTPALVSMCIEIDETAEFNEYRLEHRSGSQNTILPYGGLAEFLDCPDVLPNVATRNRITERLLALIAPEPAYAMALMKTGSPTGSAGSFSPFEAVNPGQVEIAFTSQPRDSRKDQPINGTNGPVAVKVTGDAGTAWQAVTVRILGVNNNGSTVEFSNNVAVTGPNGVASFPNLSTNKTGGYNLVAETQATSPGSVSFEQASTTSDRFNVRP